MTSLRVLKPNTLYVFFQTRIPRDKREARDASRLALEDDNTRVSAYISGSKDPWVGRWGKLNPTRSTNRTLKFRDVNLRRRSRSFFLWEIMPTNNNNRVLNRLQHMYISNNHGNWIAPKALLNFLQTLHGSHGRINLLFQPIIPAHASGVFRTIQEAERKLPMQDMGLPRNLTILRVQPGENIQTVDFESKPTLKIIGIPPEHSHHHHHHHHKHQHQHRCRNPRRHRLAPRKSSWHRRQHYYDHRRPRDRKESFGDYPLTKKTTNLPMHEPMVSEYIEPSINIQQDHSRRSSVPQLSSTAPPIYPMVGALPPGGHVMPPVNAPQVVAVPQYPQVTPTMIAGQPVPPQTSESLPVPISSSTSSRRRFISLQPSDPYYRKEPKSQNSHHPSIDSVNSNPRRRRNSESEASYYGKRNPQEENRKSNHGHHLGFRETLSHIKDKLMHPVTPAP
ncbi:uncharacterized protein EAF01_010590 [Botrytis porri]|uniref:uncharacterized protein n=1 Tax=Botrytis porri TaxID=87229 RepID=UPI0019029A7D|nr:uncharacterized protein EAF01_010590 [Botrytis porri]KAF7890781.1 hypothetical protein EAF01_010590 [Botrytis porri]